MKYKITIAASILFSFNLSAVDLRTNLELRELEFKKHENTLNKKINRSSYLPKLSLESGYELNKEHPDFNSEAGPLLYLQLKQNLYSGGKNYFESQSLNLESERLKILSQIKERDLKIESYNLLLQVELLENKISILNFESTENQKLKSMVLRKIAAGLTTNSEIIEFETKELTIADQILIHGHDILVLKEELLNKYSYQYSFEQLKKDLTFNYTELGNDYKLPLEDKLNQLDLKRTEILVSKAKTDYLPEINLEAKAGHISAADEYKILKTNEYQIAINFSLPLFSGGETYYSVKNAKNESRFEKNKYDVESLSLKNKLELDLKRLRLMKDQIKIAQTSIAKNQKHFELVQAEFKRGIKEGSDLLSAISELTESKNRLNELETELKITETKLQLYYNY